ADIGIQHRGIGPGDSGRRRSCSLRRCSCSDFGPRSPVRGEAFHSYGLDAEGSDSPNRKLSIMT
ncbi:unnamed protein product, partial [Symbiodinium microadriaticum]